MPCFMMNMKQKEWNGRTRFGIFLLCFFLFLVEKFVIITNKRGKLMNK